MKFCFTFILSLISLTSLFAQRYYPSGIQSRERVSLGAGFSTYFGDLQEEGYFSSTLNLMFSYEYQLTPRWAVRGDGVIYQLKASDATSSSIHRRQRNLSFESTNFEFSTSLMLFLFRQIPAAYNQRRAFNLYGLVGVGATYFNPTTEYEGEEYALRNYRTEGVSYGMFTPVIPAGGGILARVSPKMDVALEVTYRLSFTDYLDDVSTNYVNQESFHSELAASLADRRPEIGETPVAAGTIRGNPGLKDGYALYTFRLVYYLDRMYYRATDRKKRFIR